MDWIKKIVHDYLAWLRPTSEIDFDGLSFGSKCDYCGRRILKDSQGNWFHIEPPQEDE